MKFSSPIIFCFLLGLTGFAASSFANQGDLVFVGATLIDGTGAPPLENATLVVTDGRVRAVGPANEVGIPANAQRIDVSGKTLMPGLINAHGHAGDTLGMEAGHYSRDNLLDQLALYARYGVTTVVSLGGDDLPGIQVRNEQFTPSLQRARIYVAGSVVNGDNAQSIRTQINRNADMGVDFIKTRVDSELGELPTISPDLFQSLVDLAHARRLPVAVHIYYLEDAKMALRSGAEIIAHSVRDTTVDSEFVDLLMANEACYIPTMMRDVSTYVYEEEPDFFSDDFFLKEADPAVLAELRSAEYRSSIRSSAASQQYKSDFPNAVANTGALHAAGVKVAMGTDTGPPARFQGYFEHLELDMMVAAGMSPMDTIYSATGLAAECMGLTDLGTLEPGNWADILVLDENPATDIANTRTLESVWIAGNRVPD
jgi:imidazolonepropionase-like amidohydrolase